MRTKKSRIRAEENDDNDNNDDGPQKNEISGTKTTLSSRIKNNNKNKRSKHNKVDESKTADEVLKNEKVEIDQVIEKIESIQNTTTEKKVDGQLDVFKPITKEAVSDLADSDDDDAVCEEQEEQQKTSDVVFPNSPVYRVTDDDYNPCVEEEREVEATEVVEMITTTPPLSSQPINSVNPVPANSDAHALLNSIRNLGRTLTQNGMVSKSAVDSAVPVESQNLYDPSENVSAPPPHHHHHHQQASFSSAPPVDLPYAPPPPQHFPYHAPYYYHHAPPPPRPPPYGFPYQAYHQHPTPFYPAAPPAPPNHYGSNFSPNLYQPQGNPAPHTPHSHSHIASEPSTQYSRFINNNNNNHHNERGQIINDSRPFKLRVCHDFSRTGDCDGKHTCPMVHLPFKVCYTFLSKGYCLGDTSDPQYDPQDRPCKFKHMTAKDLENYARRNQPHLLEGQTIKRNQPPPKEQESNHSTTTTTREQHQMLPNYYTDYTPNSPPYVPTSP